MRERVGGFSNDFAGESVWTSRFWLSFYGKFFNKDNTADNNDNHIYDDDATDSDKSGDEYCQQMGRGRGRGQK